MFYTIIIDFLTDIQSSFTVYIFTVVRYLDNNSHESNAGKKKVVHVGFP